jgi:integrase
MARKPSVFVVGPVRLHRRGRYWYAHYMTTTGQVRESLGVTTLSAAQEKARPLADMLEKGEWSAQERRTYRKMTFGQLVEEFQARFTGWGSTTTTGAQGMLKKMVCEWGEMPLESLKPRTIEEYRAKRLKEGITPATTNRYLTTLRTLFKMGVQWGMMTHNPVEKIKPMREANIIPRALTDDEIVRLLEFLPDHARVAFIIAIETGMRRSELERLEWVDIDFERRRVTVRQSKNGEFRVIPMTEWLYETLQHQRAKGGHPYVIVNHRGESMGEMLRYSLEKASKQANVGHVHTHMTRHTFATRLREYGVPIDRIKELLGHKTLAMVLRYAKSSPTQLTEAVAQLKRPDGVS